MMSKLPGSEPTYPVTGLDGVWAEGLTTRQCAAITLRVPEAEEEWLNAMIRRSRRIDFIQAAMQGMLSWGAAGECYAINTIPVSAVELADVCLATEAETWEGK